MKNENHDPMINWYETVLSQIYVNFWNATFYNTHRSRHKCLIKKSQKMSLNIDKLESVFSQVHHQWLNGKSDEIFNSIRRNYRVLHKNNVSLFIQ